MSEPAEPTVKDLIAGEEEQKRLFRQMPGQVIYREGDPVLVDEHDNGNKRSARVGREFHENQEFVMVIWDELKGDRRKYGPTPVPVARVEAA